LKKLLLLLLFSTAFLLANEDLDTFITEQIKVEKQLFDSNSSLDNKIKVKKAQSRAYQDFFLAYASNKDDILTQKNPYKHQIYKLKLRYKNNQHRGNKNAALRDELLLKDYTLRNTIRETLNDTLRLTDSNSKAFFKDKINELLIKHFSKYQPINKKKYLLDVNNTSSPIVSKLLEALDNIVYLEYVANTFNAELVENSLNIYRVAKLSNSKLFTFVNNINKTDFGQTINTYLDAIHLDTAQLLLIILIIFIIILVQRITRFIINHFLQHRKMREDDIEYIHSHITNIFNTITSLIIIHLIIVVVLGFDIASINVSKIFAVLYIILIALLLYRITNTIAYLKIERVKKSDVLKNEVVNLSIKVINSIIIFAAIIAILHIIGIDLTAILSGLGIVGAAIAFAAKDSIANIFGSIAILVGDVFEQGDWIESSSADGTVVEIGLRATTIRTFDNALISVPNFELSNTGVKNWSRRSIGRRIKMNIGVTYESDFNDIKQAIEEIRSMLKEHPGIANEHTTFFNPSREARLVSIEDFKGIKRTTLVYMDEFAGSSINILVYCFSRTVVWNEWLEVKEDIMFKIADILKKNNLEFAYPTMTIHQAHEKED
jgi:MscS family membrane protein